MPSSANGERWAPQHPLNQPLWSSQVCESVCARVCERVNVRSCLEACVWRTAHASLKQNKTNKAMREQSTARVPNNCLLYMYHTIEHMPKNCSAQTRPRAQPCAAARSRSTKIPRSAPCFIKSYKRNVFFFPARRDFFRYSIIKTLKRFKGPPPTKKWVAWPCMAMAMLRAPMMRDRSHWCHF